MRRDSPVDVTAESASERRCGWLQRPRAAAGTITVPSITCSSSPLLIKTRANVQRDRRPIQQQCAIISCKNSGDGGLRRQPCRPRAAHPVKWGSLHLPLPGTSSAKFYTGSIWLAFSVVATHNLPLLSVPSFSAKRSKLHHDGIQFLFSSSEDFALASPWTGSSER